MSGMNNAGQMDRLSAPAQTLVDEDDAYIEQAAIRILDNLEFDLDMDDMYDLDEHWNVDPRDYGRLAVRRLSHELSGNSPYSSCPPSKDLPASSATCTPGQTMPFDTAPGLYVGDTDGSILSCGRIRKSLAFRRMSMDPSMFKKARCAVRRASEAQIRHYTQGFIDEIPERRGISFEKTDKSSLYVRILGDVKMQTKPIISRERRRSSLLDSDLRIIENLDVGQYRVRCGHKFYSLHQVRRKTRSTYRQATEHTAILDEHYVGQAKCLLSTIGDWHFNVFTLDKLTNGRSLFYMALHLFQEYKLLEYFHLDIVKLMQCFTLIEEGYHSNNPYHNAVHAADVGQAMHCFLQEQRLQERVTPLEKMIALLAAFTHDLDHPGVNQTFLISTSNHLAALYKNSSVLENHHWRSALCVISESGVFSHLDLQTRSAIECQIRSLILATDITRQHEFLNQFKRQLDNQELDLSRPEHRHFTLQIALKCADICNPCRPWDVSKRWSEQICDEFFQQGDYERQLHISVTPNCDRYKTTVAKIQSGFIQYVVSPLFGEWHHFNPSDLSHTMLRNMRDNKALWDGIVGKAEASTLLVCHQDACSSDEEEGDNNHLLDSCCKENININVNVHCADVPEDTVLDDLSCHVEKWDPLCRVDDILFEGVGLRRHSLPPPVLQREVLGMQTHRRGSLPKLKSTSTHKSRRRHSLPVPVCTAQQAATLDRVTDKLLLISEKDKLEEACEKSVSGICVQRPKITNLSCDIEATYQMGSMFAGTAAGCSGLTTRQQGRFKLPYPYHHHHQYARPSKDLNICTDNSSPTVAQSRSCSNNQRHILRPLSTNVKSAAVPSEGRPRGRSGSAEFSNLRPHGLHGILFERPRSLSLEHESQPLLTRLRDWKVITSHEQPVPVEGIIGFCDIQADTMATEERTDEASVKAPLLGEYCLPNAALGSHLSAS